MIRTRITSPNLRKAIFSLDLTTAELPLTTAKTVKGLATQILKDSQTISPMVPQGKSGKLKSTGRVHQTRNNRGQFTAGYAVTYGGTYNGVTVNYAGYVHDKMGWWDKSDIDFTTPGTGVKYLETHFNRRAGPEAFLVFNADLNKLFISTGVK